MTLPSKSRKYNLRLFFSIKSGDKPLNLCSSFFHEFFFGGGFIQDEITKEKIHGFPSDSPHSNPPSFLWLQGGRGSPLAGKADHSTKSGSQETCHNKGRGGWCGGWAGQPSVVSEFWELFFWKETKVRWKGVLHSDRFWFLISYINILLMNTYRVYPAILPKDNLLVFPRNSQRTCITECMLYMYI